MEPIHTCNRIERLERALLVLEGLTFLQDEQNKFANDVYMIAHSALGFCTEKSHIADWLKLVPKYEIELKEANIINVEEILNKESESRIV
jgi:beta-N-acetylglucosaminidase